MASLYLLILFLTSLAAAQQGALLVIPSNISATRLKSVHTPTGSGTVQGEKFTGLIQVWNNRIYGYNFFYSPVVPLDLSQTFQECTLSSLNDTMMTLPTRFRNLSTVCVDYFCNGIPHFWNISNHEAHAEMLMMCYQCDFDFTLQNETPTTCPWLFNTSYCTPHTCNGIEKNSTCLYRLRRGSPLCYVPSFNVFVSYNDFTHLYLYPFMYRWGNIIVLFVDVIILGIFVFITALPEFRYAFHLLFPLIRERRCSFDGIRIIFSLRLQIIYSLFIASISNMIFIILDIPKFTVVVFGVFGFICKLGFTYYAAGLFIVQWKHILEQAEDMKETKLSAINVIIVILFQVVFFLYVVLLGVFFVISAYIRYYSQATIVLAVWAGTLACIITITSLTMIVISIILLCRMRLDTKAIIKTKLTHVVNVFAITSLLIVIDLIVLIIGDDIFSIALNICLPFITQWICMLIWSVLAFGMNDPSKINFFYKKVPME